MKTREKATGPGLAAAPDPAEPAGDESARDGAAGTGRRRDPWRTAFFAGVVLAILGGAGWALLGSSLLVVRHVEVRGNKIVSAGQIVKAARIPAGQPLARVNTAAAAARVERLAPVLSATVSRAWPDAVVITVQERTPRLAVAAVGGYDLVDEHGVVVRWSARKPSWLPLLTAPPPALRGSPAVMAAASVVRKLPPRLRRLTASVSASAGGLVTLHLTGGSTVLWGNAGHAAQKSAELTLLLGTHAHYYDVSDPATAVTQG